MHTEITIHSTAHALRAHPWLHTQVCTCMCMHAHADTCTCVHRCVCKHTHLCAHVHALAHTCVHMLTHADTCTCMHTHMSMIVLWAVHAYILPFGANIGMYIPQAIIDMLPMLLKVWAPVRHMMSKYRPKGSIFRHPGSNMSPNF